MISKISPVVSQLTKYGKHKIPRYIYHLTTKNNYSSMLTDGLLKTTKDGITQKNGVFAIELVNFFKWWSKISFNGHNLMQELLDEVAGDGSLVVLKIPTENLDQDKLYIRSQNALLQHHLKPSNRIEEHIKNFAPAKYSPRYEQKGHAIEYIYSDSIPISDVEKIGEITNCDSSIQVRDIFIKVLQSAKEINIVKNS